MMRSIRSLPWRVLVTVAVALVVPTACAAAAEGTAVTSSNRHSGVALTSQTAASRLVTNRLTTTRSGAVNDYSDLGRLLDFIRANGLQADEADFATFGADTLTVAEGDEPAFLYGLDGNDSLKGSAGVDLLGGGPGDDILVGRAGSDILAGGLGDDIIRGGADRDTVTGGDGDDVLFGGAARDFIAGDAGNDTLKGGDGNDRLNAGLGRNFVDGGAGTDALVLPGLVSDYVFTTLSGGRVDIVAKDGSSRTVAKSIEFIRDASGAAVEPGARTTLQLLHASDLEGNADAVENAPNFAAIVDALEEEYATTLVVSAGDNFIPSPFSNAAGAADPQVQATLNAVLNDVMSRVTGSTYESLTSAPGRFDIAIMNAIGFDATALGNHEFDFGQEQLASVLAAETGGTPGDTSDDTWLGAQFPYLSANLTFEPQSPLVPLLAPDGVRPGEPSTAVIAPFTIIEENGERFGVIGATTQLLESISSTFGDPDNPDDDVTAMPGTNDMQALAAAIQPIVDAMEAEGVNKIILTSHLQQIGLEQQLSGLLDGVDIYVAGGSDTRLADDDDHLREDDEAQGPYPILAKDAGGNDVAIVSTDGQYSYVGRLVVEFDEGGNLIPGSIASAVSGAYATDEAGVLAVTGEADLDSALAASTKASAVRDLVDAISDTVLTVSGTNFFGETDVDLFGERQPGVRSEETNLGNLTADANLWTANALANEPVLVSLKNGGGIRASIANDDGFISELEIQQALAFNNTLTLVTLSPDQLYDVLNYGVSGTTYDADGNPTAVDGRFPQVGGVAFSFDPALPEDRMVQDVTLLGAGPGGSDVKIFEDGVATAAADDFSAGIRVVTLNFLVGGGDGYPYPQFVAADPDFADVEDLIRPDVIADGAARFTNVGTEQDALAEYLAAVYPVDGDPGNDYALAETDPSLDMRIMNLAVPGVTDFDL